MKKLILYIFCLVTSIATMQSAEAASIAIGTVSPNSTVPAGTTITFQVATDFSSVQGYTITDTFPGSTLSNSKINKWGQFSWTPDQSDIGTHNVTITATDQNGYKASLNQIFTINQASAVSIKDLTPGTSLFPDKSLGFSVAALGYIKPTYYVYDSFSGSTLTSGNINFDGNFSWTPKTSDVGIHNIRVTVTSSTGRSDTVYQTIVVQGLALKSISNTDISVGTQLKFILTPFGLLAPTYTIGDSLRNNTSDSMTINDNEFTWTPLPQDIGTHVFTITAKDINGLVANTKITVRVVSNSPSQTNTTAQTHTTPTYVKSFTFRNNLSIGSKGDEVTELQKKLKAGGYYSGPITGTYGSLTKASVIKFQKANNIPPLGNIGPATRAVLNKK